MNNYKKKLKRRHLINNIFKYFLILIIFSSILILSTLLIDIFLKGYKTLTWEFITSMPSGRASRAGILPALVGSLGVIGLTALIAIPVGVGTAIYLEEYADKKSKFFKILQLNISNLAGVPAIVYGILGLAVFSQLLKFGPSLIVGAFTLSLLILPVIIVSSSEAIKAVPNSIREGSYALGVTRWKTITGVILPMSLPGIMTGSILALSRAMGEAAPLIMVGAVGFVTFLPQNLLDRYSALPLIVFNWTSRPQAAFAEIAASGILVMLILLLLTNLTAIIIRNKTQSRVD
ncbi:MAG TPA: phosphate ABC transporter permease PstA [Erysipelotrichaceae bacterium]|nr:phosphate ABC transporter permease PstA [Erysipelotrichaceae bacterium]